LVLYIHNYKNNCLKKGSCFYFILSLIILLIGVAENKLFAQQAFIVTVTSDNNPVDYATICLISPTSGKQIQNGFTDELGKFELKATPPFKLSVYKFGFASQTITVNKVAPIQITLTQPNITLPNVTVSTAQVNDRPQENSVYKVKVITAKEIEMQSATNLRDILLTQLNIQVAADPVLGSSMAIQGMGGQHVKILRDGIPVIGRENGSIDLTQMQLQNVARIEVIQGPASTVYGADALGGVINLISKPVSHAGMQALVNSKFESVGTYNFDANTAWQKNNVAIMLNGGRNFFNGYAETDTMRMQTWKPREQLFGGITSNFKINEISTVLKSDYLYETIYDFGNPTITPYQAYAFDFNYITKRWSNSLQLNKTWSKNSKSTASIAYQNYKRQKKDYYKNMVTLENIEIATPPQQNTFDNINARADFSAWRNKWNYQLGTEINFDYGKGIKIDHTKTMYDYALYNSFEWMPANKIQIRPALRVAQNSIYGFKAIPALNISYAPWKSSTLRASIAQGYRAPSLKELYLNFVDINHNILGNDGLKPENSINIQGVADYTLFLKSIMFRLSASGFYNNVKNRIMLSLIDQASNFYTYQNSGKFISYGTGLESTLQSNTLKFDAGFMLTRVVFNQGINNSKHLSTPELRFACNYQIKKWNASSGIYLKYVGKSQTYINSGLNSVDIAQADAYTFLDWTLSKKFYRITTITTGIKNILNVTNINSNAVSSTPHAGSGNQLPMAMGRLFFVEIKIELFKDCFKKI
jgi:outer membrane receptor for ferrienterochelin and colicins